MKQLIDKLLNIFAIHGSIAETIILAFPILLFLLFIITNLSRLRKMMKSVVGLFIKFEDEEIIIHDRGIRGSSLTANNCRSCGGNKWHLNMCEYCGSTFNFKK